MPFSGQATQKIEYKPPPSSSLNWKRWNKPSTIPDLPCLAKWESLDEVDDEAKLEVEDFGYKEIETTSDFKALLYRLLCMHEMDSKRSAILHLIDNKSNYDLGKLKGAFEALILNV